ncbi:hypothetical protein JHK82_049053 [Glycine max]|nr:hypothetical protein JHK82_049053 [Glycine max]
MLEKEFRKQASCPLLCAQERTLLPIMWELNPNGTLVKSYSGLCATVESSEGGVAAPAAEKEGKKKKSRGRR